MVRGERETKEEESKKLVHFGLGSLNTREERRLVLERDSEV